MGRSTQTSRAGAVVGPVVAAVLALVLAVVPSALAVELDDGDWYITRTGVQDAWNQGVTGKGVKVAVMDDQLVADYPGIANKGVRSRAVFSDGATWCMDQKKERRMDASDPALHAGDEGIYVTHGTEMTSYVVGDGSGYDSNRGLVGVAQDAQATHYAMGFGTGWFGGDAPLCKVGGELDFATVLRAAVADGNRIVNMSFESEYRPEMVEAMVEAWRAGVVVVAGSGNATEDSGPRDYVGEPAKTNRFPGVLSVNGADQSGNTNRRDGGVTLLAPGEAVNRYAVGDARDVSVGSGGSSSASAIASGMLALVMSRWPDATGNQVLQSVVRNTRGNTSGEPVFDRDLRSGFGVIDLPRLLATDPAQYPDVNPLLEAAVTNSENHEETRGMYTDRSDWGDHLIGTISSFDLDGSSHIDVTREASLVGEEYERQKSAWAKVEQCRKDGGSDCMQYSATCTGQTASSSSSDNGQVTAPKADGAGDDASSPRAVSSSSPAHRPWLWAALGAGIAAVAALVVVICLLARRRGRAGGMAGTTASADHAWEGPWPPAAPRAQGSSIPPAPGPSVPTPPGFGSNRQQHP